MRKFKNIGKVSLAVALIIGTSISIFALARIVQAEPVDTYHVGWNLVRASDDEDAPTFAEEYDLTGVTDGISGAFEDMNSSRFHIPSKSTGGLEHSPGTKWEFVMCGKLYDDVGGTFSYSLVGWSKTNGMLQVIAEGTGALGTQAVVKYPGGADALGELVSLTGVAYTHSTETFTSTDNFDDVTVGMMARVTSDGGFTDEIVDITTVTANDSVVCDITTSAADKTNATIQINPSFWCDTIVVTALTKWSAAGTANANTDTMSNNITVLNSADNEVAVLVVDLAGLEYIHFVFYDCDGANSEEAGDIRAYGRPI